MKQIVWLVCTMLLSIITTMAAVTMGSHGDEVIILVGEGEIPIVRGGGIPIECYYSESASSVLVTFSQDLGLVVVTLVNTDTGERQVSGVQSALGIAYVPILEIGIYYAITFELESGGMYWGGFSTGS